MVNKQMSAVTPKFQIILLLIFILVIPEASYCNALSDNDANAILKRLEGKMSLIKSLRAEFVQEKSLKMFDHIIRIEGVLYMQKPESFSWHTESPLRYSLIIKDGFAKQWDSSAGKIEKISLKDKPEYNFVAARIKEWLGADFTKLKDDYKVMVFEQNPLVVNLNCMPESPVSDMISTVKLTFRKDESYIDKIEIFDPEGNLTTVNFISVTINGDIDRRAWEAGQGVR